MDLFKLGLRNVLGITLPGAILVFIFLYVLLSTAFALNQPLEIFFRAKEQQLLILVGLFLISYVLGSLMRLNAADKVDERSAEYHLNEYKYKYASDVSHRQELEEAREQVLKGNRDVRVPEDFDNWVWRRDSFPYPAWQFRKLRLYHPEEASRFFESYQRCMGIGPGRRGKEFFNYCKLVVYQASREAGSALVEEVHFAEAIVRFYAGTYFGLRVSFWMLAALFLFQVITIAGGDRSAPALGNLNTLVTLTLTVAIYLMQRTIVRRFRTLRLKEVDTVYDAFYLVHQHPDSCPVCSTRPTTLLPEKFVEREKLLRDALSLSRGADDRGGSMSLDILIPLMKQRARERRFLSSIYFAGAEGDHPFFLKNDMIALGLSVLPEDSVKAGLSKSHPHQQEAIFVLKGSLRLEIEDEGRTVGKLLKGGEMHVIGKGVCHRILPVQQGDAAYLFIKTNPALEPRSHDCSL